MSRIMRRAGRSRSGTGRDLPRDVSFDVPREAVKGVEAYDSACRAQNRDGEGEEYPRLGGLVSLPHWPDLRLMSSSPMPSPFSPRKLA